LQFAVAETVRRGKMKTKVLFVEDDPSVLELELLAMKRLGYDVLAATDGEEGWVVAQRERPDVIVLDVMLPRCDGFTLARRLRENPRTCAIPIAFVTVKREGSDFLKGFDSGGLIYLPKPFSVRALRTAVESLIGHYPGRAGDG
jgi:DNA-binding response OmpR family regulator